MRKLTTLDIWLPCLPKSKKDSQQIRRTKAGKPFITSSNEHKLWEQEMLWHLKTQVSLDKPLERCEGIILTFGIADARRRDLTNMADAIMDMLVAGSVLSDDNWKVTGKLELVPIFGKNETFVKIIYEAESLPSPEV